MSSRSLLLPLPAILPARAPFVKRLRAEVAVSDIPQNGLCLAVQRGCPRHRDTQSLTHFVTLSGWSENHYIPPPRQLRASIAPR